MSSLRRPGRVVVAALAIIAAVAAGACVGSGKTPRTESLEPLPDPMEIVVHAVDGCREGESGFDYLFAVLGPADTDQRGELARHLATKEFVRTPLVNRDDGWTTDDLPWAEIGFQHREFPLRVEVGRLENYLDDPRPHTGPPVESIPQEVRDDPGDYVVVALRPTDFQCQTPL